MDRSFKRTAAGLLALCLLAGCAGKDSEAESTATAAPDAVIQVDPIFRLTGLDYGDTVATVNGKPVEAQTYLFLLLNTVEGDVAYGLDPETEWEQEQKDAMKTAALNNCALFWVIQNKAAELGAELSAEDQAELEAGLDQDRESMGGEEAFRTALAEVCMTMEGYAQINRVNYLYAALQEKMKQEGLLAATDQELDDYIEENGLYGAKHILIMTQSISEDGEEYVEFSDEEKAKALEKIQGLYDQIMAADDKEAVFDQLMDEYSEDTRNPDGTLYAPDGYTCVYPGYMVPEFEEGAMALEMGEISTPVKTDYGYHVIMRIPVDREEVRTDVEGTYKFNAQLNEWVEEAVVETTPAVDGLDPQQFYLDLDEIRQAAEADAADATPAP